MQTRSKTQEKKSALFSMRIEVSPPPEKPSSVTMGKFKSFVQCVTNRSGSTEKLVNSEDFRTESFQSEQTEPRPPSVSPSQMSITEPPRSPSRMSITEPPRSPSRLSITEQRRSEEALPLPPPVSPSRMTIKSMLQLSSFVSRLGKKTGCVILFAVQCIPSILASIAGMHAIYQLYRNYYDIEKDKDDSEEIFEFVLKKKKM